MDNLKSPHGRQSSASKAVKDATLADGESASDALVASTNKESKEKKYKGSSFSHIPSVPTTGRSFRDALTGSACSRVDRSVLEIDEEELAKKTKDEEDRIFFSQDMLMKCPPLKNYTNQAKDRITKMLQDIHVAAFVGVGASYIATLNQILCNDANISSKFSFEAWIRVGEVFDVLHITRSILASSGYCFEDNACNDLDVLQRNLFNIIAGKRFLIILEDIGMINLETHWDDLLKSLQSAAKGSFIIVTTNNIEVVDIIHPVFTFHSLQPFFDPIFDSDSTIKLSPARQYVFKKSNSELDRLVDLFDNLQSEEYLEELVLELSVTSDDPEKAITVLTALKPHITLTRLTINNYLGESLPQWVADSAFYCLEALQLSNCSKCTSLPSLGKLPSLIYLSVKNFNRLITVSREFYGETSSSFTPFGTLKILHFEDLPQWLTWDVCESQAFPNLQELSFIKCSQLVEKLPAELLSLRKLEILDCEQLKISLPQLPQLTMLRLQNCERVDLAMLANLSSLTSLDVSFEGGNNTFVPKLEKLTSLSYLRIAGHHNFCNCEELQFPSTLDTLLISQPVDILTSPLSSFYDSVKLLPSLHVLRCMPSSLTSLSIGRFKDLKLPKNSYMSLKYLSIHDCYLAEPSQFPLGNFLMLKYLEIKNCFHLELFDITLSTGHGICLQSLDELSIDNCPDLLTFPRKGFAAPNLRTLSITNCKNLLSLPEEMGTCMASLLSLSLEDCPDLHSFPNGGLPLCLQTLRITYCQQLTSNWKQWKLGQLGSLTRLEIQGCKEVECFPPQGWLPASLTTLVIAHFPALVFLIGEALQQLTSLQELKIMYCQELLSLPEEGMPPSLKYLGIYFCPQCNDPHVRGWLNEVKEAVYDAEDLRSEILTDALHKKMGLEPDSGTTAWLSALNPFHEDVDSKLQGLNRRFEGFDPMIKTLHLETCVGQRSSLPPWCGTSSLVVESLIYGRNRERDEIIKTLEDNVLKYDLQESQKKGKASPSDISIPIIGIVGMAGSGKTTLAQLIFNHTEVNEIFQFKAWVCAPNKKSDIIDTIESILKISRSDSASYYSYGSASPNALTIYQGYLMREVAGKRILLVLDDVWDEKINVYFNELLIPLKKSAAPGSAIIMTTRYENIAAVLDAIPFPLNELPSDDCWKLFKMRAFGDPHAFIDQRLEDSITKIVVNCKGLPLAIEAVGDLIGSTPKTDHSEIIYSIADSKMWHPPLSQIGILPALLLSYRYLPTHLRRCFAYCSIFPKNYLFYKDRLILLWMAEGFIVEEENRRMEDIGKEYFNILLARSFFQVSGTNSHYFVMHDLIHDLAVYVMGGFGFMFKSDPSKDDMAGTPRHFSYVQSKYDTSERFRLPDEWSKQLRTFLPLGTIFTGQAYLSKDLLHSLEKFTHLRVLSLCGYRITDIPHSIGNLKLLCYLDFSSTLIVELPDSICKLSNLQTLLLSHCQYLEKLPEMMKHLIHLRHLDISGTRIYEMPDDVGSLSHLQTLTDFVIGKRPGNSIRELEKLSELRGTLRIKGLENIIDNADALTANLKDKSYLHEIALYGSSRFLDALKPHKDLRRLTIEDYVGSPLPNWVGDKAFHNLEVLNIVDCPHCVSLPPLGQLPSLRDILIKNLSKIKTLGKKFYGQQGKYSPFRSLVTLKFEGLREWRNWFAYDGNPMAFPSLQELYICDCLELEKIPLNLPSLVVLDIEYCGRLREALPLSQNLRKLRIGEGVGELDLTNLASFSCLTNLSLCWWAPDDENDSIAHAETALLSLTYLEDLTIEFQPSGKVNTGRRRWHLPPWIQSITVVGQEIEIEGGTNILYLNISELDSIRLPTLHSKLLQFLALKGKGKELQIFHEGTDDNLESLYDLSISEYEMGTYPAILLTARNLTTLSLSGCTGLTPLPNGMAACFPCLLFLSISRCDFTSFPTEDFPAQLKTLEIRSCRELGSLPEKMSTCTSLMRLVVDDCPLLRSFPRDGLPPNLHELHLERCKDLLQDYANSAKWQLKSLSSLQTLYICGDSKIIDKFPAYNSLPTSLTVLTIRDFEKLRSINGMTLRRITGLRELEISRCPELRSVYVDGFPGSLCRLSIKDSPLAARCRNDVERYSHIAYLELEYKAPVSSSSSEC